VLGGADSSAVDTEAAWLCWKVVQHALVACQLPSEAGLLKLRVNSLGTIEERQRYSLQLRDFFLSHRSSLSPASQQRLEAGGCAMRILDSKHADDAAVAMEAPPIAGTWGTATSERFESTLESLYSLGVPVEHDARLARGLDYYNGLCWELQVRSADASGARALTLAGGGRYDTLSQILGSKKAVPAVGKSCNVSLQAFRLLALSALHATGPIGSKCTSASSQDGLSGWTVCVLFCNKGPCRSIHYAW
jgi:histidyl-tRNA synthetase